MKELCITIPCELGKVGEHLNGPVYIYDGKNSMAAYKCPHCGQTGPRVRPLKDHMGLTMNKKASCPALKAQDQMRRESGDKQATPGASGPVGRSGMPTESNREKRPDVHSGRTGCLFPGDNLLLDNEEHQHSTSGETTRSSVQSSQDANTPKQEDSRLSDELFYLREKEKLNAQS